MDIPTALITGASRGLGRALATERDGRGWRLVIDGRNAGRLAATATGFPRPELVTAISGDVTDPAHRDALAAATGPRLDLLGNNASELGPSPLPRLADLAPAAFEHILRVNVVAPLALTQRLLPALRSAGGRVLDISSDAAVEAYAGWGGYGASKAALDQLTAVLAAEEPELRLYAVDPGDMATHMHQAAFPGEDISDRPAPETVVPALLALLDGDLPSGRYRAADLVPAGAGRCGRLSRSRPTPRLPRRPSGTASPATRCGCWPPARPGSPRRGSATCPACSNPVTCSWSTRRRHCRRASRRGVRTGSWRRCTCPRRWRTAPGWSRSGARPTTAPTAVWNRAPSSRCRAGSG